MSDQDRRRAFDALWARHVDAVFGYARRRADEEPAREALAETFTVAWRRLIARLGGLAPDAVPDLADASAEAAAVRAAFLAMSRRDREALALVAWDGLSPSEAAVVCGCSVGAFTTRLHRARGRMAEALADQDAPPVLEQETS